MNYIQIHASSNGDFWWLRIFFQWNLLMASGTSGLTGQNAMPHVMEVGKWEHETVFPLCMGASPAKVCQNTLWSLLGFDFQLIPPILPVLFHLFYQVIAFRCSAVVPSLATMMATGENGRHGAIVQSLAMVAPGRESAYVWNSVALAPPVREIPPSLHSARWSHVRKVCAY